MENLKKEKKRKNEISVFCMCPPMFMSANFFPSLPQYHPPDIPLPSKPFPREAELLKSMMEHKERKNSFDQFIDNPVFQQYVLFCLQHHARLSFPSLITLHSNPSFVPIPPLHYTSCCHPFTTSVSEFVFFSKINKRGWGVMEMKADGVLFIFFFTFLLHIYLFFTRTVFLAVWHNGCTKIKTST
jgi:hypothetical protein